MPRPVALAPSHPSVHLIPPSGGDVLVAAKTPFVPRPVSAMLPAHLTLQEAITALPTHVQASDDEARRVLDQIGRETAGSAHHFLVINPSGGVLNTPREATLGEIAVPREVRSPGGLKSIPTVLVEVQAYAPVGR